MSVGIYKGIQIPTDLIPISKYMNKVNEYSQELVSLNKTWDNLEFLAQFGQTKTNLSETKSKFSTLTVKLLSHLCQETLNKTVREMGIKSQNTIDILVRNLFERTADIGFLATDKDIREFLSSTISKYDEHYSLYAPRIKDRFKEYVSKYSVYFDIVLLSPSGDILIQLDQTNSNSKSKDVLVELALNCNDDFVESYKYHDFLPQYNKSLVYAYKVTQSNEPNSKVLGVLALCFRFDDEMNGIFSNLVSHNNKECITLLDSSNKVISSSDIYHIPIGATMQTVLDKPYKIVSFGGRDYLAKTSATKGYQGFFGLGWYGHIMIPLDYAFVDDSDENSAMSQDIILAILQNNKEFSSDLKSIPIEANMIQQELNRALWNGNIQQSKGENTNKDFTRLLFGEIGKIGSFTKDVFSKSITNLTQTMVLNNTTATSSLMIDIMDRNLYERANDCRWWALSTDFRQILDKDVISDEDSNKMSDILAYINNLYTVYTNLFIYDSNGIIVATSQVSQRHLIGKKITSSWVENTLSLKNTSDYCVSNFEQSLFYDSKHTYIYNAAIKSLTNQKNLGGIGIVFDAEKEFADMLNDSLPKDINGNIKADTFALFVSRDKKVVSSSTSKIRIGDFVDIDDDFFTFRNGNSYSKIVIYDNKYYAVGATCSNGYREYKSATDNYKNDIIAIFFSFISDANLEIIKQVQGFSIETLSNNHEEKIEIASFYVGHKWLGIYSDDVIEAISIKEMENSIDLDSENIFKGTVIFKDNAISVLDIKSLIKEYNEEPYTEIVIVKYKEATQYHYVGILVNRLGNISEVNTTKIKPIEKHFITGGTMIQSVVVHDGPNASQKLLTILNLEKLSSTFIE
ncbi:chemotaxis protein CheW [Arcobacter sp. FWKO B]|uniref:chemotaxis protein CheW n=1 Tax=Arcobacter sp. FWKO B TaxID=2593672 RepID=UPI001906B766|nr:chemotaxis protein CheW [Arcobacter sp. FWKO B]